MTAPPAVSTWRAVERVAAALAISQASAIDLLCEAVDGGELELDWRDQPPPSAARGHEIDWRAGVLRRSLNLPRSTFDGRDWQVAERVWVARLRRADVEALIAERAAAAGTSPAQPDEGEPYNDPPRSLAKQLEAKMQRFAAERGWPALNALSGKQLAHQFGSTETLARNLRNKLRDDAD